MPQALRGETLRFGISGSTPSKKQTLMQVKSSPARINKARGHRISLSGRCHVNLPDGRTAAPDLHPFCYRNLAVTRSPRYDGRLVCDLNANAHTHTHSLKGNIGVRQFNDTLNNRMEKLKQIKAVFFNIICKRHRVFSAF